MLLRRADGGAPAWVAAVALDRAGHVLAGAGQVVGADRQRERRARRVLERFGTSYRVQRARRRVQFVIANPTQAHGDEHPYARELAAALRTARVPVVLYRVP